MALACTFISTLIMHPTDTFSPPPPAAKAPVRRDAAPYNTYLKEEVTVKVRGITRKQVSQ